MSPLLWTADNWYLRNVIAAVGAMFLLYLIFHQLLNFFSFLRAYVLAPTGIGCVDLRKYGSWAVVTGASEGIGKAYSFELARRGLNVVLMSRSREKLTKVADVVSKSIYTDIFKDIRDLNIGVLVNNVGIATEYPDYLTNLSTDKLYSVIQINCQAIVQMTHMVLPGMLSRGGGVIVNLSSTTSLSPLPQSVVYSATKMFINYISAGLRKEYEKNGIIVQNVKPFFVATPGTGLDHSDFFVAEASAYAKSLVATIGIQEDTYGSISHALQGYFSSKIPPWIADPIVNHASNVLRERWHTRMEMKLEKKM